MIGVRRSGMWGHVLSYQRPTSLSIIVIVGILSACAGRGPEVVTSIQYDGERRTITTRDVSCVRQPDDSVVILVSEGDVEWSACTSAVIARSRCSESGSATTT